MRSPIPDLLVALGALAADVADACRNLFDNWLFIAFIAAAVAAIVWARANGYIY